MGAYDINYFDIQTKVKKEDEEDEDLKIEKPGFGSYDLRFEWEREERKKEI